MRREKRPERRIGEANAATDSQRPGKMSIYARIYFYAISNDLQQKFIVEFSKFNWGTGERKSREVAALDKRLKPGSRVIKFYGHSSVEEGC